MKHTILDGSVTDLLCRHPSCSALLSAHDIHQFNDPEVLATFGRMLRVRTVLRARGINEDLFMTQVQETTAEPAAPGGQWAPGPNVNLLALLPCPLKIPLEEALNRFLARLPVERRAQLQLCIEGNANLHLDFAEYADHFRELDEMPDIIITPGFNSFFHRPFVERFILTGQFQSSLASDGDQRFSDLGVADPDGHYDMLAMNLLLPVVDLARLGSRPLPRRWVDLLDPVYQGSIAIRGNRDGSFCESLLMSIQKDFGRDGLVQLGRNVSWGWHPSQMVKAMAGSGDGPAISVMPLFFARTIRDQERALMVWPEDGAMVSPVTLLVKAEKRAELADLLDFLGGPEVARICAGAFFPTLHPQVDNQVPDGVAFNWIGWEYVKQNDVKGLVASANDAFASGFCGVTR